MTATGGLDWLIGWAGIKKSGSGDADIERLELGREGDTKDGEGDCGSGAVKGWVSGEIGTFLFLWLHKLSETGGWWRG